MPNTIIETNDYMELLVHDEDKQIDTNKIRRQSHQLMHSSKLLERNYERTSSSTKQGSLSGAPKAADKPRSSCS